MVKRGPKLSGRVLPHLRFSQCPKVNILFLGGLHLATTSKVRYRATKSARNRLFGLVVCPISFLISWIKECWAVSHTKYSKKNKLALLRFTTHFNISNQGPSNHPIIMLGPTPYKSMDRGWHQQWQWQVDHNDPSKPSHRLTNGLKPSKTIESDGSKTKNHWKTIDCNGQTTKKHSMVMVASKTIENFQWSL